MQWLLVLPGGIVGVGLVDNLLLQLGVELAIDFVGSFLLAILLIKEGLNTKIRLL